MATWGRTALLGPIATRIAPFSRSPHLYQTPIVSRLSSHKNPRITGHTWPLATKNSKNIKQGTGIKCPQTQTSLISDLPTSSMPLSNLSLPTFLYQTSSRPNTPLLNPALSKQSPSTLSLKLIRLKLVPLKLNSVKVSPIKHTSTKLTFVRFASSKHDPIKLILLEATSLSNLPCQTFIKLGSMKFNRKWSPSNFRLPNLHKTYPIKLIYVKVRFVQILSKCFAAGPSSVVISRAVFDLTPYLSSILVYWKN